MGGGEESNDGVYIYCFLLIKVEILQIRIQPKLK